MKNKQVYIDLLNKALTVPKHETLRFYDIRIELESLLSKCEDQSLYTKALHDLNGNFYTYEDHDLNGNFYTYEDPDYYNLYYGEDELIESIKNTLAILNTPLKQLEEEEAAIARQLKLDKYHKELPLKLLELLAEADSLGINYRIFKCEGSIMITLSEYINGDNKKAIVMLDGQPWQLEDAETLISLVKSNRKLT
jgi:hypothetical protein